MAFVASPSRTSMSSRRSRSNRRAHRKNNSDASDMIAPAMDEEADASPAPTDPQLVLLCLDYLRQIRRKLHHNSGHNKRGSFQEDYLTLAIYALSRSFTNPKELVLDEEEGNNKSDQLLDNGNDPWFQKELSLAAATAAYKNSVSKSNSNDDNASTTSSSHNGNASCHGSTIVTKLTSEISIPTMEQMENEIIYKKKPPCPLSPYNSEKESHHSSQERDDNNVSENPMKWYEYDNAHYSNQQRFYPHDGLASTPLHLPDLIHTACDALGAKSRVEGEKIMVQDAMFHDFVDAVKSKGFFKITDQDVFAWMGKKKKNKNGSYGSGEEMNNVSSGLIYNRSQMDAVKDQIYQDRYRKVVDKFRYKLEEKMLQEERHQIEEARAKAKAKAQTKADAKAAKARVEAEARAEAKSRAKADARAIAEAEAQVIAEAEDEARDRTRNETDESIMNADDDITVSGSVLSDNPMKYKRNQRSSSVKRSLQEKLRLEEVGEHEHEDASTASTAVSSMKSGKSARSSSRRSVSSSSRASINRKDIEEAERLKATGNVFMQQKKYAQARNSYTAALAKAPNGPTSHVYYSNRAAALLSMRNFTEAVWDAEKSIALKPDYPKAHARLGLAHFLLGQFQEAVDSYYLAVKYEPTNQTSISYLDRSKKKLAAATQTDAAAASLSVIYDDDNRRQEEDEDFDSVSRRSTRSSDTRSKSRRRQTVGGDMSTTTTGSVRSSRSRSRRRKTSTGPLTKYIENFGDDAETNTVPMKKVGSSIRCDILNEDPFPLDEYDQRSKGHHLAVNEKFKEADRIKIEGNKAMARKEYSDAVKLYSKALKLAPAGPSSHIYFSNRAAALCYLERYEEAELDSERALALNPEFGKAHARLGLSRYFLRDYDGAVDAYETALLYDPDNESNRIYLAKAKLKLSRRNSTRISE